MPLITPVHMLTHVTRPLIYSAATSSWRSNPFNSETQDPQPVPASVASPIASTVPSRPVAIAARIAGSVT